MNKTKRVSIWGNAISIAEHHPESYARNITLRYPVYIPFDGSLLRFTFDNYCGTEPICISSATAAPALFNMTDSRSLKCPVSLTEMADITFGSDCSTSVIIPPGERIVSNPVSLSVKARSTLCVSIYFKDFTLMQSAVLITGPLSGGYFSMGDMTHCSALPPELTKTNKWVYFLSDIDMITDSSKHALVCYGDSITAQSWPDYLTMRISGFASPGASVIRKAASGTRVLRQYSCITYDSYGLKGTERFLHELPVCGADTVIIQQGINDIIHPVGAKVNEFRPMSDLPSPGELIEGLKYYSDQAHQMKLNVWFGTLLPIRGWRTFADFREELRCSINDWIRTCSHSEGYIDFDAALRDPGLPDAFRPEYDSGDHLHPSEAAYKKMSDIVPEKLLL